MSRFTDKYGHKKLFDVDTSDLDYINLESLYTKNGADKVYPVKAIFINHKSKFGDAPVIVTDENIVNLPKYLLDDCLDILSDKEAVEDINNDIVGFTIYTYTTKNTKNDCYSIDFVDR